MLSETEKCGDSFTAVVHRAPLGGCSARPCTGPLCTTSLPVFEALAEPSDFLNHFFILVSEKL